MRNFNDNRRSGGGRSGGFGGGRSGGYGGRDSGRPQLYKATCSDCGAGCEVPFRPTPGKPVLCDHCFRRDDDVDSGRFNNRGGDRGRGRDRGGRDFGGERRMHKATCDQCGASCELPFKPTGEKPVYCSNCFAAGAGEGNGGKNNGGGTNHTALLAEIAELHEKQDELTKKIDKIIALLQRGTPIKEHVIGKSVESEDDAENVEMSLEEDNEVVKTLGKKKKSPAKKKPAAKKAPAKKAIKKAASAKGGSTSGGKKAPVKKKTAAKKK